MTVSGKITSLVILLAACNIARAQTSPSPAAWHFDIGGMYEIENVEGQGEDKDGLYEPSIYFNAAYGDWSLGMTMYQEGPADYGNFTRGGYLNRPEFRVRYQFIDNDQVTFGLTGNVRNYGYHFKDEHGAQAGTANTQRYGLTPDWNINFDKQWSFNGWLSLYQFVSDLDETGYSDSRIEAETGIKYQFNQTVALKTNYYIERGFNLDENRNNGEFSTQEMRIYLPIQVGNNTFMPYTRLTIDRWSNWDWNTDLDREGHNYSRIGLFYGHDFDNGLSMSLEYAYEWEDHDDNDSSDDRFHYAGIGVNYAF
ncbi:OmpG family monomeric porin [Siccibacter colletis]|uniref:OmpG family monomeric porin n=1 Tax=Siccibacter colletis TaxID=1505757 RepID=UPI0028BDB022|nr:OmpG family monomeric porin [Siccibacter colletis]WNN46885.1 OmpG family monomeric porin [Siccibacter colletis]